MLLNAVFAISAPWQGEGLNVPHVNMGKWMRIMCSFLFSGSLVSEHISGVEALGAPGIAQTSGHAGEVATPLCLWHAFACAEEPVRDPLILALWNKGAVISSEV